MSNNSTNARRYKHAYLLDDFWELNLEYFIKTYPASKAYWMELAEKDTQAREGKMKTDYLGIGLQTDNRRK